MESRESFTTIVFKLYNDIWNYRTGGGLASFESLTISEITIDLTNLNLTVNDYLR